MMMPDEVHNIREALGSAIGEKISTRDFGMALGLSPDNASRSVRRWENTGPTGPAAVAMRYLEQGLMTALPEFVMGEGDVDLGDTYLIRLHFPRFVARWNKEIKSYTDIHWIDEPNNFGPAHAENIAEKAFLNAPVP